MAWMMGKSRLLIASTNMAPIPGQSNPTSTTTDPDTAVPIQIAMKVIMGSNALRNTCTQTTFVSDTPLARASFTNSASSTSNIDERNRRVIEANSSSEVVIVGSTKCLH